MNSERFQIIPRKKGQLIYPILLGIVYISAFIIIFLMNQYNINYFILTLIILTLGLSSVDFLIWRWNWHKLGEITGFNQEENNLITFFKAPNLSGTYRGYRFYLSTFTVGYGRSKKHYTKIEMDLPFDMDADFSLKKKSFLQQNLGFTGIEEFDKRFYLNTDTEWVKNRLFQNRDIRDGVFDILKQSKSMQISLSGNRISHQEKLRIKDTDYLLAIMDFLIKMTIIFRQNSQGSMF